MKKNMPAYALAAAIVVAGLVIAGVPARALFTVLLLTACPLMMFFMMRGMSGMGGGHGHDGHGSHRDDDSRHIHL
jgi:hypothetical protein